MNSIARRLLMDRMRDREYDMEDRYDMRYDGRYDRRGYDGRMYDRRGGDYEREEDMEDGRRGVKGTGRYSRYRRDRGEELSLEKSDINRWKHALKNSDGTTGPHFDLHQIVQAAESIGIRFDEFDELELCMAANMLYSDLGEELRSNIPPDREAVKYASLAKAWLCDKDGPEPSEKLAIYYYCIAKDA